MQKSATITESTRLFATLTSKVYTEKHNFLLIPHKISINRKTVNIYLAYIIVT